MSTRNVSAALRPNSLNRNTKAFAVAVFPEARTRPGFWDQVGIWLGIEGCTHGPTAFARECWQRMRRMKATFEQGGLSLAESHERREDRRRDEEAWSRMDDEGCPNEQPYPGRDAIRTEAEATHSG